MKRECADAQQWGLMPQATRWLGRGKNGGNEGEVELARLEHLTLPLRHRGMHEPIKIGWEAGIRTPIGRFRVSRRTKRRKRMNDLGLQMKNKSGKIRNTPTTKLVAKVGIPDNIVTSLYQIDALAFPRCASKEERTLVFKLKHAIRSLSIKSRSRPASTTIARIALDEER